MPTDCQLIVNLPNFRVIGVVRSNPVEFRLKFEGQTVCPHCSESQRLRKKTKFERLVRHESFGLRQCWLRFEAFKFHCLNCKRYFNQRFPGIKPHFRVTEAFRKEIYIKHHDGVTRKRVSERYAVGWATVERWYQYHLKLKLAEFRSRPCPRVLGIDEHFFSRKQGYATTFADLSARSVYDIALGRSEASLTGYLNKITDKSRTRVVLMDLSDTYKAIAKRHFPKALIVADRFHVVRLVNHQFMATWKLLDPTGRKNRGLVSLMRRHHFKLSTEQKRKLRRYFKQVPGLEIIYDFKQSLSLLLLSKHKNKQQCRAMIPNFLDKIEKLKLSPFEPLQTLGTTLDKWKQEIARMWRFNKTNSITEGLHNKMEVITRQAYGFRNFQNYKLRVKVLCA